MGNRLRCACAAVCLPSYGEVLPSKRRYTEADKAQAGPDISRLPDRYTVLQMDGHRIVRVKIENLNQPSSLEPAI